MVVCDKFGGTAGRKKLDSTHHLVILPTQPEPSTLLQAMLFKRGGYWPLFHMQEGVPFESSKRGSCICDCEERGEEEEREQLIYIKAPSTSAAAATIDYCRNVSSAKAADGNVFTNKRKPRSSADDDDEWDEAAEQVQVAKKKYRKICSADGCVDQVVKGGLCIRLQKSSLQSTTGPDDRPLSLLTTSEMCTHTCK